MFETKSLIIRPVELSDASFFYKLMNLPSWIKYIGDRNIHSVQDAEAYIEDKMLSQFNRLGYGNYLFIHKVTGEKMGATGLFDRPGVSGIDIGFSIHDKYKRNGYTYESAKCILDYAIQTLKLPQIQAFTTADNIASQKLIEKLGLSYTETKEVEGMSELMKFYVLL